MNRIIGLAILAVGVILLILGLQAGDSLASEVKEAVEGTPTDETVWYLIGGGVALAVGLGLIFIPRKRL